LAVITSSHSRSAVSSGVVGAHPPGLPGVVHQHVEPAELRGDLVDRAASPVPMPLAPPVITTRL
jgi:hypothetical protein